MKTNKILLSLSTLLVMSYANEVVPIEIIDKPIDFGQERIDMTKEYIKTHYGFSQVQTTKGFLVLELGELTCQKQTDWLQPRLKEVAAKIAHFIIKELER